MDLWGMYYCIKGSVKVIRGILVNFTFSATLQLENVGCRTKLTKLGVAGGGGDC